MSIAQLGDRSLFYLRRGSGEPLLLIQGMAGHHQMWGEPLLTRLEQHFDVVAYDHRGVGESSDDPVDMTIAALADDADALMRTLGWSRAHVLGISMGGMVAQELALRHPTRIRTLVLGCTYAGGAGSTLEAPGPARMLAGMQSRNLDTAMRATYSANLSAGFVADESHFAPFQTAALSVLVPAALVMRQAQAALGHHASERLPSIAAPTLVIHGTADEMLNYSNGVQIASLIPAATLRTFEDTGHLFWWEHPAETATLVTEHCAMP